MAISRRRVEALMRRYIALHGVSPNKFLPRTLSPSQDPRGRLYEARVLVWLCSRLRSNGYRCVMTSGPFVTLRWNGGFLDRRYSFVSVFDGKSVFGEIWTDIWTYSHESHKRVCAGRARHCSGDYREIDIVVTTPNAPTQQPLCHRRLILGIECKARKSFDKEMYVSFIGLRRFVSLLGAPKNQLIRWSQPPIKSRPASVLVAATTDSRGAKTFAGSCINHDTEIVHIPY